MVTADEVLFLVICVCYDATMFDTLHSDDIAEHGHIYRGSLQEDHVAAHAIFTACQGTAER